MDRIQLSANFFLDEFTRSQTAARHGVDMSVPLSVRENLQTLCERVLQPIRDALGPVYITSGYRPKKLNNLIGGLQRSQHIIGAAADILVTGCAPIDVCQWVADNLQDYDQCILEYGQWTHVSIGHPGKVPREQDLTSYRHIKESRTCYLRGFDLHPYRKQAA